MKIYTRTGDKGTTALLGGTRVPKHHIRIESYGTVDELNSFVGLLRDQDLDAPCHEMLLQIQDRLLTIGSLLATDPVKKPPKSLQIAGISESHISVLEKEMDRMNSDLPEMTHFILPGGHQAVSVCHICRSVCRRAERHATALFDIQPFEKNILVYLNRLSDYFFVLARKLSKDLQASEIQWNPRNSE